jgi:WhiB family redox-sensing transcriptional regulator
MHLNFMRPPDWMDDALCAHGGIQDDLWFPAEGAYISREVKTICGMCPVKAACLAYAIDNGEAGMWAGTSADQRRRINHVNPAICKLPGCDTNAQPSRNYCSHEHATEAKAARMRARHAAKTDAA